MTAVGTSGPRALLASRRVRVAAAVVAGCVIVPAAVGNQLSARLTGREYLLRVAPYDPVDPFRGAYAALSYPDLRQPEPGSTGGTSSAGGGTVFVPLIADGTVWKGGAPVRTAPSGDTPYLRCHDEGWRLRCGIESWFLPQARAAAAGRALADGAAVAVLRVDGRGNAALVEVKPRG
jgi:uncharacterized membrane-anchored protein